VSVDEEVLDAVAEVANNVRTVADGLKVLHKQISVDQNLRAVEILKQVGLLFEFGFMMFDPSSTLESIRANVRFLRAIIGDGSVA
jgi:anaerobic magnesium-protoporphyrin IX monomethyl ester cyclase